MEHVPSIKKYSTSNNYMSAIHVALEMASLTKAYKALRDSMFVKYPKTLLNLVWSMSKVLTSLLLAIYLTFVEGAWQTKNTNCDASFWWISLGLEDALSLLWMWCNVVLIMLSNLMRRRKEVVSSMHCLEESQADILNRLHAYCGAVRTQTSGSHLWEDR